MPGCKISNSKYMQSFKVWYVLINQWFLLNNALIYPLNSSVRKLKFLFNFVTLDNLFLSSLPISVSFFLKKQWLCWTFSHRLIGYLYFLKIIFTSLIFFSVYMSILFFNCQFMKYINCNDVKLCHKWIIYFRVLCLLISL